MSFVNADNWRRALIYIAAGQNRKLVFQSIGFIVRDEVARTGSPSSVITSTPCTRNYQLTRYIPLDSDSMLSYYSTRTTQNPLIAIDIYAD